MNLEDAPKFIVKQLDEQLYPLRKGFKHSEIPIKSNRAIKAQKVALQQASLERYWAQIAPSVKSSALVVETAVNWSQV